MKYIARGDEVGILPMTVRLSNCLRRLEINTIGDLLDYAAQNSWTGIPNMGAKTAEEARQWVQILQQGSEEYCLISDGSVPERPAAPKVLPLEEQLISALPLSKRAKNALTANNISNARQLVALDENALMNMHNMGKTSVSEVLALIEKLLAPPQSESVEAVIEEPSEEERALAALAQECAAGLGAHQGEYLRAIYGVRAEHPEAQGETLIFYLYQTPAMRSRLQAKILSLAEASDEGVQRNALYELLPAHLLNTTLIEEALIALESERSIQMSDTHVLRRFPSFADYAASLGDEKIRSILLARLDGVTMEEIGERLGITRERVRQLIERQIKRIKSEGLRFAEDQYAAVFELYGFTREDFMLSFGEDEAVYNYLEMTASSAKGERRPLEELLEDENFSTALRRQAERAVYKNYVAADGVRIRRDRAALVHHFIRKRCTDTVAFDDFFAGYHRWLEELGLSQEPQLMLEARTYENKLGAADYVLWVQGRRFRYYEIAGRDFGELLEELNLSQYENIEISALKLFRDHPELMAQYDVRDANELHNLLKKLYARMGDASIDFARNPTLCIGEVDRDSQVLDLLLRYAPIPAEELARLYEEEYGVKGTTMIRNYMHNFSEFYFEGVYSIDADNLPYEQFARMQELLCEDFYTIPAVRTLYKRTFPEADVSAINPYTLKTLGFKVYTGYIVRATWSNAADYFNHLLTKDDVVDGRMFEKSVYSIQAYTGEMNRLRRLREIVEFAPRQYINARRLAGMGITTRVLEDYCRAVKAFVRRGEFFSIKSLREDGFVHELDDLGFDEWFYSSVLLEDRENFAYQRIGGTRIFRCGTNDAPFIDMLADLIGQDGHMDIYDLRDLLEERYGVELHKDKLIEIIRSTDMYYDAIMQAAYIDYDTYFEEV